MNDSNSNEQTPRAQHSLRSQGSERKIIKQNAEDFFTPAQKQRLKSFFERQGETIYEIFQNTITSTGVMTLFIVFSDLKKDIREVVVDSQIIFRKNLLFPSTFDNIILKKYRKVCSSVNYILKCKYCDFICFTAYTLEHMAFVHDRHYGFGLKNSSATKAPPLKCNIKSDSKLWETTNMSYCIFQTPQSGGHHYFRDHFKNLINYRYKQLDVQFNNEDNLLSTCYEKYLKSLRDNRKLYTIQSCDHPEQFYDDTYCKCVKMSIVFYKAFHSQLYHILCRLNLMNWREGRFEAKGYIRPQKLKSPQRDSVTMATEIKYQKLRKHTRKNSIFMEFVERICKLYPNFFEESQAISPRDSVTLKVDYDDSRNGDFIITPKQQEIIEVLSSDDSNDTMSYTRSTSQYKSKQQEIIDVLSSDDSNDTMSYTRSTSQYKSVAESHTVDSSSTSHTISSSNNAAYKLAMHENLKITGQFSLINPNPLYYVILSGEDNKKDQTHVLDSAGNDIKIPETNIFTSRLAKDTLNEGTSLRAHLIDSKSPNIGDVIHSSITPNVATVITSSSEQLIPYITTMGSITTQPTRLAAPCESSLIAITEPPLYETAVASTSKPTMVTISPSQTGNSSSHQQTDSMGSPPSSRSAMTEDTSKKVLTAKTANSAITQETSKTERTSKTEETSTGVLTEEISKGVFAEETSEGIFADEACLRATIEPDEDMENIVMNSIETDFKEQISTSEETGMKTTDMQCDEDTYDSFFESQLDTFIWPTNHQAEVFRNHIVTDTFHFDPIEDYRDYDALLYYAHRIVNVFQQLQTARESEEMSCPSNNKITSFVECLHLHEDYLFAPEYRNTTPEVNAENTSKEQTVNGSNHSLDINQQVLNHLTAANSGSFIFYKILDTLLQSSNRAVGIEVAEIPQHLSINCENPENQRLIAVAINVLQDNTTLNGLHLREIGSILNTLIDNNMN